MKRVNKWRILVVSDASQKVKHLSLSKFLVFSFMTGIAILTLSLIGSLTFVSQLSNENTQLKQTVVQVEEVLTEQEEQITTYEDDRTEIEMHIEELELLEEQLTEMIATLEPNEITAFDEEGPQGGIELAVDRKDIQPSKSIKEEDETIDLTSLKQSAPSLVDRYENAIDQLEGVKTDLETIPVYWPADTERITSEYGYRSDPFTSTEAYHSGIDLADGWGTEIYATGDGIVSFAGRDGGYGLSVIIDHPNSYETRYAHLGELDVEVGEQVQQGDLIGLMGSTGRSTGVHLHYEIIRSGETVDPYPYMSFLQRVLND
ncbi:M23 family metallopeptidase [Alkalibacillus silvisoli]|uniref:M23 family metallopeptidase n=1 Tax=Alkalibacillus silvisoli TaxID=392823 RepID=A0ABN1A4V0_9BACI